METIQIQPTIAHVQLTPEQISTLIQAFATVNPPLFSFPEGKSFGDIKGLSVNVRPDEKGNLMVRF